MENYHRTARPILFAGVIDPVDWGGIRKTVRSKTVPDNVGYFFNRWQTNVPWPVDIKNSGSINCLADACFDQREQSVQRNHDGSAIRVRCGDLEVGCSGAKWKWEDSGTLCGYWKWFPGMKNKPVSHSSLIGDAFVQQQMIDALGPLLQEFGAQASTNTPPGSLSWYRHNGWQDGTGSWAGGTKVGHGWQVYKIVLATSDGTLYGIRS